MDEPKHLHEPGGDFQCLHEFIPVARKKLSDHVWGYLVGAAESEERSIRSSFEQGRASRQAE